MIWKFILRTSIITSVYTVSLINAQMELVSIKAIQFGIFIRFKYQQKFIDINKIDVNVYESCFIFSEVS